ncbi:hypothetical protein PR048_000395 [Dryococelus australis]|uniref:Uncharacterized protein n=1 Tax=Dryococelus australis TaxID=614101 RepID=A0ABQ9IEH7_9NEOP|nr:hypothetical protein PR048_000395 [Dryococelus australis]
MTLRMPKESVHLLLEDREESGMKHFQEDIQKVAEKVAQNWTTSRSNVISNDLLTIFNEPSRLFNGGESSFHLLPQG